MKQAGLIIVLMSCVLKVFAFDYNHKIIQDSTKPKQDTVISLNGFAANVTANPADSSQPVSAEETLPIGIAAPANSGSAIITSNINSYVAGFITNYYKDNTKHFQIIQSRSEPYFTLIDKVFQQYGIPKEMRYLAVIESGLNTNAVSRVGAVGAWQFMAGTARLLGLHVSRSHDDRRNLYKSTTAAAKYLSQLHSMLNDWLLVVAAYDCGPGGVLRAIKQSGSTNFFQLQDYLPSESKGHVLKFLATAYILDRFSDFFGLNSTVNPSDLVDNIETDATNADESDLATLTISGKYSLPIMAKYLSMDINVLNRLNPGLDKMMSDDSNSYELKLPADKMEIFKANESTILNESVQLLMDNNSILASYAPVVDSSLVEKADAYRPPVRRRIHHYYRHHTIHHYTKKTSLE
jgi:peptidoglycan lytic transglycosylase D